MLLEKQMECNVVRLVSFSLSYQHLKKCRIDYLQREQQRKTYVLPKKKVKAVFG